MPTDFGQWDRVASQLRACREAQQEAWGDVDNATLGRYLAGDVTPQERRRIETELQHRPELRKLTDLVSDVLRDCEPVAAPTTTTPSVLSFAGAHSAPKSTAGRWRQWAAVAAAACLLLGLAYTVLPRGAGPAAPLRANLASVTPANGTFTAFRPTFRVADAAPDIQPPHAKTMNDRDAAKKSGSIKHVAVVLADGCAALADTYNKHDDLDMAEFSYKLAYNIRDWTDGSKAEPTVEARRNLGNVYQTALSLDEATAATQAVGTPASPVVLADKMPPRQMVISANQLRERLARQRPDEVRTSVVPILVENLNEAKTPKAREQLGRALAELGAAAKDAVPALDACLRQQDLTQREREVVREAKERLENTAWPAADPAPAAPAKPE